MAKKQSALDKLLGINKPEPEPEPVQFEPNQEQKEPEVEKFMVIDGSPVPGIKLRQILRGHTDRINRIAWSPNGHYLGFVQE